MPQVFQVLRCYKCFVFQVHHTKKVNKFECKLCGEKQSIKRHYGVGTAKDCRLHVQKLNGIRGELDELTENQEIIETNPKTHEMIANISNTVVKKSKTSKWSQYVEIENEVQEPLCASPMYLNNMEVVLDIPKKRQKAFGKHKDNTDNLQNCTISEKHVDKFDTTYQRHSDVPSDSYDVNEEVINYSSPFLTTTHIPISNKKPEFDIDNFEPSPKIIKKEIQLQNKIVPTKVDSNSRWAQFVETIDCDVSQDDVDVEISPSTKDMNDFSSDVKTLFSLCDDKDIDDVLDI